MDLLEEIALDHREDRAVLAIVTSLGRRDAGKAERKEKRAPHRIALPLPRMWPRQAKPTSA